MIGDRSGARASLRFWRGEWPGIKGPLDFQRHQVGGVILMSLLNESNPKTFVDVFFSADGPIPAHCQRDCREAFELHAKQTPETNARRFRTWILGNTDTVIRDALSKPLTKRRDSISGLPSQPNVPAANGISASTNTLNNDAENVPPYVIFSWSEGITSALRAREAWKEKLNGAQFKAVNPQSAERGELVAAKAAPQLDAAILRIRVAHYSNINRKDSSRFFDTDADILANQLTLRCQRICQHIADDEAKKPTETALDDAENDKNLFILGRVIADSEAGLNEYSALLEMFLDNGRVAPNPAQLMLNRLQTYALFPGQSVGCYGTLQNSGARILPCTLIGGVTVPSVEAEKSIVLPEMLAQRANILVASGPFVNGDGFDTSLLDTFVDFVESEKPSLLLLLGPFVDIKNKVVAAGDPLLSIPEAKRNSKEGRFLTYEELYAIVLNRLIYNPRLQSSTYVVLVPSVADVSHLYPIPQPPLDLKQFFKQEPGPNILPVTNPARLELCECLRVAVTSADPIGPLLTSLVTKGHKASERLRLIHSALLTQLNFFPIHPLPFPIDPRGIASPPCAWTVQSLPHCIIYSSDKIPAGLKMCDGRLFINAGRLVSRGTPCVCRVKLSPINLSSCSGELLEAFLRDNVAVEVLRLDS